MSRECEQGKKALGEKGLVRRDKKKESQGKISGRKAKQEFIIDAQPES